MEPRRFSPRLLEVAVVLAGVIVAVYAGWVIRNGGANATPPSGTVTLGTRSESPSPSAAPSPAPTKPPRLTSFRKTVANAKDILVVGDSTGSDLGDWVDLWAQDLAENNAVTLHMWDADAARFEKSPPTYGTGASAAIWNLSYRGVKADYVPKLEKVRSAPGAVIFNLGHDRDKAALRTAIQQTSAAIRQRWGAVPTAWILQNPSSNDSAKEQETAVAYVRRLATVEQVPVIDIHTAFVDSGRLTSILSDGMHPNNQGSRLWADTLEKALRQTGG